MKIPTTVKHRDAKHGDSAPDLWKLLLCWSLVLTSGAFTVTLASGAFIVPPDAAKPVRFSEHVLVNEHRYTLGIAAVDIDGDGRPDLAIVDNR